MMSAKNHAELLFEDYLRSLPVDFAYEPEVVGKSKRPDYRVEIDGNLEPDDPEKAAPIELFFAPVKVHRPSQLLRGIVSVGSVSLSM